MSRAVFLCLVLFVGSASAWHNWFSSRNKPTECGKFEVKRWRGWFFQDSMTDVDTRNLLADIKAFDTNNDGYVSFSESSDPVTFNSIYPTQNLITGVPRCTYAMVDRDRYAFGKEVSSVIFDILDANHDLKLDMADQDPNIFNLNDADGDGRVSHCELFRGFIGLIQQAEEQVYLRKLKYTNLLNKYRKPWHHMFSW